MKLTGSSKNPSEVLDECYYLSQDGSRVLRNYTCHEIKANIKGQQIMDNFFNNRVYPMTSAFDGQYDVMDGVRTAVVLGMFLFLLVVHTTCKGSQNKRKIEIQISSARDVVMKASREHQVVMNTYPGSTGFYDPEERRAEGSDHSSDLEYQGAGFWRKDRRAMQDHTCIQATAQWIVKQPLCHIDDDVLATRGSTVSILALVKGATSSSVAAAAASSSNSASMATTALGAVYNSKHVHTTGLGAGYNGKHVRHSSARYIDREIRSHKQQFLEKSGFNKIKSILNNIDVRQDSGNYDNENSNAIRKQFYDPEAFTDGSNFELAPCEQSILNDSLTMVHSPVSKKGKYNSRREDVHGDKVGYRLQSYAMAPIPISPLTAIKSHRTDAVLGGVSPPESPSSPRVVSPSFRLPPPPQVPPTPTHRKRSPYTNSVPPPSSPILSPRLSPLLCRPHPCQPKVNSSMSRVHSPSISNQAYEYVSTS